MREYGFLLTRILPYEGRILDSQIRGNAGDREPVFRHILRRKLSLELLLQTALVLFTFIWHYWFLGVTLL